MRLKKALPAILFSFMCCSQATAQGYDALQACRTQSLGVDNIHSCMDNYLNLIDKNLADLTIFIDGELQGSDRAAFNRAQNAFYSYRRENCLWYLEISGPRLLAEQVGKNCLAEMSQKRLAELQGLIGSYQDGESSALIESVTGAAKDADPVVDAEADPVEPEAPVETPVEASPSALPSERGLSAFFGQWSVSCSDDESGKRCVMEVPLKANDGSSPGSIMRLTRRGEELTGLELRFPEDKVDNPDKLSWRVDNYAFGTVPGSIIRIDGSVARQIINERKFLRDDLLPLFRGGTEVGVTLLDKVNGSAGKQFEATLVGFSRTLTFSDEFISGELP